jgi:hypothetical protein
VGWVTLDDGQHVYIGSGGEFLPRGPTAKTAGGKAKPAAAPRRKPAPAATTGGAGPVKSGPQALRDYYAAKGEHARLSGQLAAGDKGVKPEHVARAHEELTRAKNELLRTKLDQERRQVAATAASKPAAPIPKQPATAAGEPKFSLMQRAASRSSPAPQNMGKGTTRFMFDMKRGDKPGQTTIFDKLEAKPATAAHMPSAVSAPAKPSLREQVAAARAGSAADREDAASRLGRLRREVQSMRSLDKSTAEYGRTPFKEYGRITPKMRALTEAEGRLSGARKQIAKQLKGRK